MSNNEQADTYAIDILAPDIKGTIVGTPDEMNSISDKLREAGISHVYLYHHHYFWTPFGMQEHL